MFPYGSFKFLGLPHGFSGFLYFPMGFFVFYWFPWVSLRFFFVYIALLGIVGPKGVHSCFSLNLIGNICM